MNKEEAMQIVKEAIDKIEEEGFTVYDSATADQNRETSYAAIACVGTCLYIQAIEGEA